MPSVRRLTAILAADVAGYSRLMGADEEGTHERLNAHLGELVNPKIGEHRGRVVKNTGDGFLAEFHSVVCEFGIEPGPCTISVYQFDPALRIHARRGPDRRRLGPRPEVK